MATIVTRTGKGSALTFAEGDANFTNLNTDKLEDITSESIGDLSDVNTSTGGNVTDVDDVRNPNTLTLSGATSAGIVYNTKLRFTGSDVTSAGLALNTDYYVAAVVSTDTFEISTTSSGSPISLTDFGSITDFQWTAPDLNLTNGSILSWSTADSKFVAGAASSGISNVVEDTTPQLGGNLDVNGSKIYAASGVLNIEGATDSNINLTALGTGDIQLTPAVNGASVVSRMRYSEKVHALGSTDTPTISLSNGNVQTVTITSSLTVNAFGANAGDSVTLIVSGTGTLSGPAALVLPGGTNTLTTLSVVSIFYDGTNYLASIATDFQ